MKIKLERVETYERQVQLRLPFHYGDMVITEVPQVFLRAKIRDAIGRTKKGIAAEVLAPKWFDKNPKLSTQNNFDQIRQSICIAANLYLSVSTPQHPFTLSFDHYRSQLQEGSKKGLIPLVAGYGPALLDRAVLDAVCRLEGVSFWEGIRKNLPGFRHHQEASDLDNFDWDQYLCTFNPLKEIQVRHTVGLSDPITNLDQELEKRINDGLPETLEEVILEYGNRFFKVKVSGHIEETLSRMKSIAAVLDSLGTYHVTLDANEQFDTLNRFQNFIEQLATSKSLQRFWKSILFIEQPLDRRIALEHDLRKICPERPVIIDESDGKLNSFINARQLGYRGVTSKACKGVYKAILNQARCSVWNRDNLDGYFFMSGEDLTTQAGVAVQQDLAVAALLGLGHIERNGHHYVKGFSGVSLSEQSRFISAHPDLYQKVGETVCLKIRKGGINLSSLDGPGFGTHVIPDFDFMDPVLTVEQR